MRSLCKSVSAPRTSPGRETGNGVGSLLLLQNRLALSDRLEETSYLGWGGHAAESRDGEILRP